MDKTEPETDETQVEARLNRPGSWGWEHAVVIDKATYEAMPATHKKRFAGKVEGLAVDPSQSPPQSSPKNLFSVKATSPNEQSVKADRRHSL